MACAVLVICLPCFCCWLCCCREKKLQSGHPQPKSAAPPRQQSMADRFSIAKLVELKAKLLAMLAQEKVTVPLHHEAVSAEEAAVHEHKQRLAELKSRRLLI